ncbi:MAG: flagellar hook-associated protein FlgL [Pseudomonadales bacterium]|jgi:flagellar hook-associated protein 3 FlgL|nr:flagellar hook-associated protein FlgL [Pseudomonadales bacterium]
MRISSMQIFTTGVRHITNAQAEVARAQEQISSGKRVLTPADDPAAAALALGIRQEKARSAQYQRNADLAQSDLQQQDVELESVETVLLQLREYALQAGNATLSANERSTLVAGIEQAGEQLLAIFNTRSTYGDYLFAGFSGDTPPFVPSAAGRVDYVGDDGERRVAIGAGLEVQSRNNGRELFVDIPAAANTFVTRTAAGNSGSGDISAGRIVDQAAYDAVYPDDLVVRFGVVPGTYQVDRIDRATGALSNVLPPQPHVDGVPLTITVAGAEVRVTGSPSPGDEFVLEASTTQSLLLTVQRLADGLRNIPDTEAGATERARVVAEALNAIERSEQSVTANRAALGPRLNLLDDARAEQVALDLINDEALSDLVDLDYDEAASRLSFQSFVLAAAQQSLAKIANLSLFNFLR